MHRVYKPIIAIRIKFNSRREKIGDKLEVSIHKDELQAMAIKMMGKVPNSLNDCAKLHPIIVSEIIANDLSLFWSPRQSLRRQNSDAVVEKKPVVKKERKKPCLQCSCSLGKCSNTKVLYGTALMHFSMHQLKGDNDSEICPYCGKDHDAPTTNSTGKNGYSPTRVYLLATR